MTQAAVLIDNMYLQNMSDFFNIHKIDIPKFSRHLLNEDETLFRTFVFDALPYIPNEPTPEQLQRKKDKADYFNRLKYFDRVVVEEGYVKGKDVKCPSCYTWFKNPVQKAVDVKISVRLLELALHKKVSIIVLVSGDGDLVPAVEAANQSDAAVRLRYTLVPGARTSSVLIKTCPEQSELKREDLEYCRLV